MYSLHRPRGRGRERENNALASAEQPIQVVAWSSMSTTFAIAVFTSNLSPPNGSEQMSDHIAGVGAGPAVLHVENERRSALTFTVYCIDRLDDFLYEFHVPYACRRQFCTK